MRRNDPKTELTPTAIENCKKQIWQLPYLDRVCILALSVVDRERDAVAAANGLIALVVRMSEGYSHESKIPIADCLRDAADVLDYELKGSDEAAVMLRE